MKSTDLRRALGNQKHIAFALVFAACVPPHTKTADTFVRIEHTGCLGWCQVYTLTLYADGAVQYQGSANVPTETRWTTIAPAEVARLMDLAERVPQWRCDPARITTDQPGSVNTVSRNGHITQRIAPNPGDPCTPDAARELQVHIDVVGHASYFIGN
ncbi:MAG: DUF6438 domain-containing protein [Deltaproteobacteria bacterium]